MNEEFEMTCFQIITYVGTARTCFINAIQSAKEGKFDEAEELLNQNIKKRTRRRQTTTVEEEKLQTVKRMRSMINATERLTVVDSIVVNKKNFLDHIKLSEESGTLHTYAAFFNRSDSSGCTVYRSELGNKIYFSQPDENKTLRLYTSDLVGGKWTTPHELDELEGDTVQNYPFMMSDGVTLYYAAQGNESIGGYDIFVTRYDMDEKKFLYPENIGMPYNSPFDDYLLVIDELNGIGWWATDRNLLEDQVTIYIFKYNEIRNNYSATREDIAQLAAITSIKDTWEEKNDYEDLRETIANISLENEKPEYDFTFHLKNGVTYHMYDDFTSTEARSLMQRYLQQQETIATKAEQLTLLRGKYHKANASEKKRLAPEILQLENQMRTAEEDIQKTANSIRSAELSTMK